MGRLDDIIERNRNPRAAIRKAKGRRGVGLAGVVLFVVLVLLIFTDLWHPPEAEPPRPGDRYVPNVMLGAPTPSAPRPAGSGSMVPTDAGQR